MPKQTWVNINGTWRNVKTAWLNVAGVWKKITPKGNINGVWKEFIQYLLNIYSHGVEYIPLIDASDSNSTIVKGTDRIELKRSGGAAGSHGARVTTETMIDVTNYSRLHVEAVMGTSSTHANFKIFLSTAPTSRAYVAEHVWSPFISTGTELKGSLDITSFTGEFYVGAFTGVSSGSSGTHVVHVYKLWLE